MSKEKTEVNQGVRQTQYSGTEMLTFYREFFSSIRAVVINGISWFMLKDVANAIGIINDTDLLISIESEDVIRSNDTSYYGVDSTYPILDKKHAIDEYGSVRFPYVKDRLNRVTRPIWINESGLNAIVINLRNRDKKIGKGENSPTIKQVKRWITGEILPTIRRYGIYGVIDEDEMQTRVKRLLRDRSIDSDDFMRLLPNPGGRYQQFLEQRYHNKGYMDAIAEVLKFS